MDLWDLVPSTWVKPLEPVKPFIERLSATLNAAQEAGQQILPPPTQIFRALQVSPDDVRVVVVGQDPYPNAQYACGLSFSVPAGTKALPGSLRNIVRELISDMGSTQAANGDLQPWVDQGVLLLNRTLTVVAGQSGSHAKLGWEEVTNRIIDVVVERNPQVVALLWGNHAQTLAPKFDAQAVVCGVHPSPLSAHRGFVGSRPFSAINQMLTHRHQEPIRW